MPVKSRKSKLKPKKIKFGAMSEIKKAFIKREISPFKPFQYKGKRLMLNLKGEVVRLPKNFKRLDRPFKAKVKTTQGTKKFLVTLNPVTGKLTRVPKGYKKGTDVHEFIKKKRAEIEKPDYDAIMQQLAKKPSPRKALPKAPLAVISALEFEQRIVSKGAPGELGIAAVSGRMMNLDSLFNKVSSNKKAAELFMDYLEPNRPLFNAFVRRKAQEFVSLYSAEELKKLKPAIPNDIMYIIERKLEQKGQKGRIPKRAAS